MPEDNVKTAASGETFEFQSEAKRVLELMIHSVYSNPDIFLRELISNASDAIDKLRIEGLTDSSLSGLAKDGRVTITIDKQNKTLTVSDNGIGMARDDLVSYLGTIARSGTKEFIRAAQDARSGAADLIGQFGVGFYSSFIVAKSVTVISRKAGDAEAWKWDSSGDGSFTIEGANRDANGTDVIMLLKNRDEDEDSEAKDYLSEWTLRELVKKYSDFVSYPIYITSADKEKKDGDKEKKDEPVNSMKAIWLRPEGDVSGDEYDDFYKHITHDWEAPLERIVYNAEGKYEFHALLYIPRRAPLDMYYREGRHGIQLYIRRVFIMNDCRDLLPEYLRFVKGVVDSEDLPLNISRELLQQDRQTAAIKSGITRKTLDVLRKLRDDRPDDYKKFWDAFGSVLKEGVISDAKNKDAILGLALFESSNGSRVSLREYADGMAETQKDIYYIFGGSADLIAASPKLEAYRANNVPVLLLSDPVDEVWPQVAGEFDGHKFVSVASEDARVPGAEEKDGDNAEEASGVAAKLKEIVSKDASYGVEDVCFSKRLVSSPATFSRKGAEISAQMRAFFKSMGQDTPPEKRTLELNGAHPIVEMAVKDEGDDEKLASWASLLIGLASIADGEPLGNGKKFTETLAEMLKK